MKQVILISGGSEGIGRAIAERLAPRHTVIIMSSNGPKCLEVAKALQAEAFVGDVTDYAAMERAVAHVTSRHGRLDVVINNAGLWIEGPLETNDPAYIHRVLEVNTLGTINLTHAALPTLKQQGSGRIINIISQAGLHAKPEKSVYDASKFAVTGFTQALQLELTPHGIGVTGVYPGKVKTQLFEKAGNHKSMADALDPADVARAVEFVVESGPVTIPEIGLLHLGK